VPETGYGPLEIRSTGARRARVTNVFYRSGSATPATSAEHAVQSGLRVRWTPAAAPVKVPVELRAAGLPRRKRAVLRFRDRRVVSGRTNRLGELTARFTVPRAKPGRHPFRLSVARRSVGFRFSVKRDPMVVAAGDIACDPLDPSFLAGVGTREQCRQHVTAELARNGGPAAVLALGDLQYENGALDKFEASYNPTWGLLKPITHPVVGNHEYFTRGAAGYFDYFNGIGAQTGPAGPRDRGYYSFDVGTWHLIALNSNCRQVRGGCAAGSPQEQWLRADLAAHPTSCTLAYWHHPRFSSSGYQGDVAFQPFWQALYDYHADVVLNGHSHSYQRYALQDPAGNADPQGIREIVVGTGGRDFNGAGFPPVPNREVADGNVFGVLRLTLHPSSYEWRFVADGTAFVESGESRCR
jgi:calcineurin-like phosphoesterase family protein